MKDNAADSIRNTHVCIISEFQDTSLLHIPQNALTEESIINAWSWILTAYLKELKTGEYNYNIIVWYQRFLWALSTAGIKKMCANIWKIFWWLAESPARCTIEREAAQPQCYLSQIKIKKENQIFYTWGYQISDMVYS